MSYNVVVFNKTNGNFRCYSEDDWAEAMLEWREELMCGPDFVAYSKLTLTDAEVFAQTFGTSHYFTKLASHI
tara:strand:+ start:570 stop:785 length:216 start_codon:yes stop_codon:yes gene_type:complete